MLPPEARAHVALLDHTADLALELTSSSLPGLYEVALLGVADQIVDLDTVRPDEPREIRAEAPDRVLMLVRLLREALYLYDTARWLPSRAAVRIAGAGRRLTARLAGEPLDRERHQVKTEIKAITYHGLSLDAHDQGFRARIVLDL